VLESRLRFFRIISKNKGKEGMGRRSLHVGRDDRGGGGDRR